MAVISFDIAAFRVAYPAFASEAQYPDATLSGYWDVSSCYISTTDYGWLNGACRALALNLMTAHIAQIATGVFNGQDPAVLSGATIDKVSVTVTPPPMKSQFGWWLSTTPYGAQLWALLQVKAVGGLYIGGRPELSALRKVGGRV